MNAKREEKKAAEAAAIESAAAAAASAEAEALVAARRATTPLKGKAAKDEAKKTFEAALAKHRRDAQASGQEPPLEAKVDYCTGKGPFGGDVWQPR